MKKLLALALLVGCSVAQAATINATGTGWCNNDTGCNNTNTLAINNHFAGESVSRIYRNWIAFNVPTYGAQITSATISIWNDGQNSNSNPTAVYNLYEAASISFGGLTNGPSLGQILVDTANTGVDEYITITLNAAGLAVLNANQGGQLIFGGNNDDGGQIFGYTGGVPSPFISANVIPIPAAVWLFGSALAGLGWFRRK